MHSTELYLVLTNIKQVLNVIQFYISHNVVKLALSVALTFDLTLDLIEQLRKRKYINLERL